eukprot:CAMPEP_0175051098 /NCGR_PEP_ID=MMETSP0052_2-20121109/7610_1 /TAXON_ID=51329 ORGANISM="Polytomella parva, Strain SAG 63-3" /NCGR_SAMPLE_ID=MMETSP0052_2 /ASSEMBLY_ACC=CAM_ASM_000194 /LENGTH=627 /DNA_ID=CAMNT_0016315343 /DNA_START=99 /DNA_END=1978 /DNA_ORIENTATION=-
MSSCTKELLQQHFNKYAESVSACSLQLIDIYNDLRFTEEEQLSEFLSITSEALSIWNRSVVAFEEKRVALQEKVDEILAQIHVLKVELGEDYVVEEGRGDSTLMAYHDRVYSQLRAWEDRKSNRLQLYRTIKKRMKLLYQQMGLEEEPSPTDIKSESMETLQQDCFKLQLLREEKLMALEDKLTQMRRLCDDVGEDYRDAAASVHHSLRNLCFRERCVEDMVSLANHPTGLTPATIRAQMALEKLTNSLTNPSLTPSSPSSSSPSALLSDKLFGPSIAITFPSENPSSSSSETRFASSSSSSSPSSDPDLTQETFRMAGVRIQELAALKAERESAAAELLASLKDLWATLGVPPLSSDRKRIEVELTTPHTRCKTHALEQGLGELARLEGRSDAALKIVSTRASELAAACALTHIPTPDLDPLLAELQAPPPKTRDTLSGAAKHQGRVASVLSHLVSKLGQIAALAKRRAPVINAIEELREALVESAWLRGFEADEGRYRGRDANRRIQRSIRAAKLREKIPALQGAVRTALATWMLEYGKDDENNNNNNNNNNKNNNKGFLFDGVPYEMDTEPPKGTEHLWKYDSAQTYPLGTVSYADEGEGGGGEGVTIGLSSGLPPPPPPPPPP